MNLSQHGLTLLQESEGLRLIAYQDIAGVWTIGYGTTRYPDGSQVQEGDTCTKEQAEYWLLNDAAWANRAINEMVSAEINQKMHDALCAFVYNIGETAFHKSSLLRQLNQCNYKQASLEFDKWNKARVNGVLTISKGLAARRDREQALFDEGIKELTA
jgi:lysozyme